VADGSLDRDAFSRWMVADYACNLEYRRFLAGLIFWTGIYAGETW
jgi:hypothetical protein